MTLEKSSFNVNIVSPQFKSKDKPIYNLIYINTVISLFLLIQYPTYWYVCKLYEKSQKAREDTPQSMNLWRRRGIV